MRCEVCNQPSQEIICDKCSDTDQNDGQQVMFNLLTSKWRKNETERKIS